MSDDEWPPERWYSMTNDHWPPEGTRVRVLVLDDDNEGELMIGKISGPCVLLRKGLVWPVQRHEIEVIDAVPKD